jgi:hypothetical protein
MPKIDNLPVGVPILDRLRRWVESKPDVPEGDWYKDLGSFKILRAGIVSQDVPAPRSGGQR